MADTRDVREALERLRRTNDDPELIPVPERDFLTDMEAEFDPTVDVHERDLGWPSRKRSD